ncbi:MAG: ECF-type sigma factor [Acidobacteriota bacterium]
MRSDPAITHFLDAHAAGDPEAFEQLVAGVYDHLRLLARQQIRRSPAASLASCELVHEAFVKLAGGRWRERGHFFAAASRAMRHVLVDRARRRRRQRRGGGHRRVELELEGLAEPAPDDKLLALDAALEELESRNPRLVRVVECRFFAGLSEVDTAAALGVSESTVQRDWRAAKVLLAQAVRGEGAR